MIELSPAKAGGRPPQANDEVISLDSRTTQADRFTDDAAYPIAIDGAPEKLAADDEAQASGARSRAPRDDLQKRSIEPAPRPEDIAELTGPQ